MEYSSVMSPRESKADTATNRRVVELIRSACKDSGMRRDEIAEKSGVPDGTLGNILAGRRPVYVEQMIALARALDVDARNWIAVLAQGHEHDQEDELEKRRVAKAVSDPAPTLPRVAMTDDEPAGAPED